MNKNNLTLFLLNMKKITKALFILNFAIGIIIGSYIVFLLLNEEGIFDGSNKGVFFTVLVSLLTLFFFRNRLSKKIH